MPSNSEYHDYEIPDDNEVNWGDPLQRTLQALDRDTVVRRETVSDIKSETPREDVIAYASDSERFFIATESAWLELDTLGPDPEVTSLTAEEDLTLPVVSDNSTVTASDGKVWFNDGSGPNAAGVYYYDENSQIVGPVGEGDGSAPQSLSGLSIDTTKDFGGFSLTGMGHDEVDVPQTFDLVVDDFDRESLDDYVGSTEDAQIVTSPALEGNRSLQIDRSSSGASAVGTSERQTLPQFGDIVSTSFQITDSGSTFSIVYLADDPTNFGIDGTQFLIGYANPSRRVSLISLVDGNNVKQDTFSVSEDLTNTTVNVTCELSTDGSATVTFVKSDGTKLGQGSHTLDPRISSSGAVVFEVFNGNAAPTTYVDAIKLDRRTPQETRERQRGSREIAKTTARGGVSAGPPSAQPDERRRTIHRHPVTTDSEQGQRYVDAMTVGGSPVAYVEGEFDGNGSSYGNRLNTALGRFSRVNANLSWQTDTLADAPFWDSSVGTGDTVELVWPDGRVDVNVDGGNDGESYAYATTGVSIASVGEFAVTFHGVDFTDTGSDRGRVGIGSPDPPTDRTSGDHVWLTQGGSTQITKVEDGSTSSDTGQDLTFPADVTFTYDGSDVRVLGDGQLINTVSFARGTNARPLKPWVNTTDNGDGDVLSVDTITVEPLTEVLR